MATYYANPSQAYRTTTDEGRYALLITDEDEGYRRCLQETFEPKGYNTYLAGSGREAIEIAREVILHALIMDTDLPDISGLETFGYIKREARLTLPCIFLSGDATKELMLKALSANAYTVISKPMSLEVLLFAVEQLIKKYYLGEGILPTHLKRRG
ncbi:MAG: response regulator [Candidatus Brocadiales bacterium]